MCLNQLCEVLSREESVCTSVLKQHPKSSHQQFSTTITLCPRGCEPKGGGSGGRQWLGPSPALESSGLCFLALLHTEAGEVEERRMFGFTGRRPLSASLQPWLHFPEVCVCAERGGEVGAGQLSWPPSTEGSNTPSVASL